MINCIVFDCDGTLVDSEYLCSLGLETMLREYEIEVSALEMKSRFQGARLKLIIDQLELENKIKFGDDFVSSYRGVVERLFEEQLKPCEGVVEMLQTIQLPICVASSGPPEKMHKALSITGLLEYFNGNLFSSYEINSWKPAPDIFTHASNEMGFSSIECAVVEDSLIGINGAISAGMMPIHYDPNSSHGQTQGIDKISHMRELKGLVSPVR